VTIKVAAGVRSTGCPPHFSLTGCGIAKSRASPYGFACISRFAVIPVEMFLIPVKRCQGGLVVRGAIGR